MGKFYSLDLRERAVAAYLGGESCRSVGARFQIAPSTGDYPEFCALAW